MAAQKAKENALEKKTLLALATRAKIPTDIAKGLTLPPLRQIIQRKKDLGVVTVILWRLLPQDADCVSQSRPRIFRKICASTGAWGGSATCRWTWRTNCSCEKSEKVSKWKPRKEKGESSKILRGLPLVKLYRILADFYCHKLYGFSDECPSSFI